MSPQDNPGCSRHLVDETGTPRPGRLSDALALTGFSLDSDPPVLLGLYLSDDAMSVSATQSC